MSNENNYPEMTGLVHYRIQVRRIRHTHIQGEEHFGSLTQTRGKKGFIVVAVRFRVRGTKRKREDRKNKIKKKESLEPRSLSRIPTPAATRALFKIWGKRKMRSVWKTEGREGVVGKLVSGCGVNTVDL